MRFYLGCLGLCAATSTLASPVLGPKDNCVAWKARKTTLLVAEEEPVGRNCSATLEVQRTGEQQIATLTVPVKEFDSGEPDRDEDVYAMLTNDGAAPHIVFEFRWPANQALKDYLLQQSSMTGALTLGGRRYQGNRI